MSGAGRPKLWSENMEARFPKGTFRQIKRVLDKDNDETRTDFVRMAVAHEITRRLNDDPPPPAPPRARVRLSV
jgi:hypothetical protein